MDADQFVEVDGSYGEGGGQILRTALTISSVSNFPVKVVRIRGNRPNPGLKSQHIAVIKILAEICNAEVKNVELGSNWISFKPKGKINSSIKYDIGTAGSITLALISVIPVVSLIGPNCDLEIIGGTDVNWSPTIDYFRAVVLPLYRMIGLDTSIDILRRGYYPKGGGIVKAKIKYSNNIRPLSIVSTRIPPPSAISVCSNLPRRVAERQVFSAFNYLAIHDVECGESSIEVHESLSPGSSIVLHSVGDQGPFLGSDSIGERGKPSDKVGEQAAHLFLKEYLSKAPIDSHAGDIITTPLFFAEGASKFKVSSLTSHLSTNLEISSFLTGRRFKIEKNLDGTSTISISEKGVK